MDVSVEVKGLESLAKKSRRAAQIVSQEVAKALLASGMMIDADAKKSLTMGGKTGIVYEKSNPRRTHRASAPGQAPASDTGRLVNSIGVRMVESNTAVEVFTGGTEVKYAVMLEFGTKDIAPRPFMHPAAERNRRKIKQRFDRALKASTRRIGDNQ